MPSPPLSIVQSLSPRIAVLSSDDVIATCEANGCRGLEELLRPWEGGTERVSILSSTLTPAVHPTFPLRFVSYSSVFPLPETSAPNADIVVDLISSHVGSRSPEDEQHYPLNRGLLLSTRPVGPYETFNHPVGFLIAVSTSTPEPLETLRRLVGRATGPMSQAIPWLDGVNVMRFFVVVHDVSKSGEDLAAAHELLASVKKTYGPHSTLLVINSKNRRDSMPLASPDVTTHPSIPIVRPFTPDEANPSALSQVYASALSSLTLSPTTAAAMMEEQGGPASPTKPPRRKLYGSRLTAEDTQRLAALVRELVIQSLIPWMEGRIREWNEVWQTNRRGLTGRLFGAGRKLFSSRPSSPSPNAPSAGYNAVKGYYPISAVEALTRRLADFAFMLRDYKFASTVYDSLRRDFAQDRAWRYAAASTEMYGLSLLLAHNYFQPSTPPTPPLHPFTNLQHTDISSWLEQAVLAYQGRAPANQIQLDALRITVLYYEAWKAIGEWRGVGMALVKAAGDADEVPSAVMIEEAATADTKGGKSGSGKRRRAFHLVLAAQRYETAGLKKYSRRCLERASMAYQDPQWSAAQDRIEYSLGRQAYTLGESDKAVERFLRLLRKEDTGMPGSQGGVLEDMGLAYEQMATHPELLQSSKERLQLPTPIFNVKATRIVLPCSHASTSGSAEQWIRLEQRALASWDRKGKKPITLLPEQKKIQASIDEPFVVELLAENPLNAPLIISNLTLVTSPDDVLTVTPVSEFELDPYESRVIPVEVVATQTISGTISSVSFLFHRFFPCTQSLEKQGKRLQATKAHRITPTYAKDTSLTVEVGQPRPRLQIEWEDMPEEIFAGEQVDLTCVISNTGKVAVNQVQMLPSENVLRRQDSQTTDTKQSIGNALETDDLITLFSGVIQPGEAKSVPLLLSAYQIGPLELRSLIMFSNAEDENEIVSTTTSQTIIVSPLLDLRAQNRPARSGSEAYLAVLEVTNTSFASIYINQISPISAVWRGSSTLETVRLLPNQSFMSSHRIVAATNDVDLTQQTLVDSLFKLVAGQTDMPNDPPLKPIHLQEAYNEDIFGSYIASRRYHRLAYLQQNFPTIPQVTLQRIFPLFDPSDLDFAVSWHLDSTNGATRRGVTVLHGSRVAPEFSLVEMVREQVEEAINKGGKTTRTMYEETGRLRQVLIDSVLDGVLAVEDDPVEVAVRPTIGQGKRVELQAGAGTAGVTFVIRNRSLKLPVGWVLRLNTAEGSKENPVFTGVLNHQGRLNALSISQVETSIWTDKEGMIDVSGWTLHVETGEECQQGNKNVTWRPRRQWSRRGEGNWIQVVRKS